MEKGSPVFQGSDVSKGIDKYYEKFGETFKTFARVQDEVELKQIKVVSSSEQELPVINHGEDLKIQFVLRMPSVYSKAAIGFTVFDKEQRPVGILLTEDPVPEKCITAAGDNFIEINSTLNAPRINLSKGIYSLTFFVSETISSKPIVRLQSVVFFQVISKRDVWPPIEFECEWGS